MSCPLRYITPLCAVFYALIDVTYWWIPYVMITDSLVTLILSIMMLFGSSPLLNDIAHVIWSSMIDEWIAYDRLTKLLGFVLFCVSALRLNLTIALYRKSHLL